MSTHSIYRVTCDAPHCPATGIIEKITDSPDGWRRVTSTDHLADWQPGQTRRLSTGRRSTDPRTRWDITAGSITLHLCPNHTTVFDGHLPRTEGGAMGARDRERRVSVACSCGGMTGGSVKHWLMVGSGPEPSSTVERAWWRHLPAGLREYAARGRTEVAA